MLFYHLWLLIQKSLRYAWRRRVCRCCPKIVFELLAPVICLLFLILVRWIHTPTPTTSRQGASNANTPTQISIRSSIITPSTGSDSILNYTSTVRCPSAGTVVEVTDGNVLRRLTRICPQVEFVATSNAHPFDGHFIVNGTSPRQSLHYRCGHDMFDWCRNVSNREQKDDTKRTQHPSSMLCKHANSDQAISFLNTYFAVQSLLNPPNGIRQQLTVYTWPCPAYFADSLFQLAPSFVLLIILILIDGSILYGFNLLFHELIEEKRQGMTELLRLISVCPMLNSLAWLIRVFAVQMIISVGLILVLKLSFDGATYLAYTSLWLLVPTIIIWTVQAFSRAVLVAHFFTTNLKAGLWSWVMYIISFVLAYSSWLRLPASLHFIASAWLPFYSIKRLFILLFRINTSLGRSNHFTREILLIWLSMLIGIVLMWLLAYYLEQTRPGKYGIPRPWLWPLHYLRDRRTTAKQKRRESVAMQMIETGPNSNTTVRVSNLNKTYTGSGTDRQVAVDDVSFTLEKSIIYGLIGHNGAGKTTTMEMICGLLPCDCGTIEIHDKNLRDNLSALQPYIGYCPQQDMLFSHLTVREQLEFYARVRSKQSRVDDKEIDRLLSMMGIEDFSQRLCHQLSGGTQRKLSILCAFAGEANVILLDEPSSSLDPVARRVLWTWLRENKANRTLLVSSHLLDEVEELCDSVIILDSGKIRAQGTVLELKQKYGRKGDRLHLAQVPSYVPKTWVVEDNPQLIEVPDRKKLIELLQRLERDNIKYSLENITLDDIFIQLTSTADSLSTDNRTFKSQISVLFEAQTSANSSTLLVQQTLAVLFRRGQVLLRRARLLPIILLLYLAYALAPTYMPSFSFSSGSGVDHVHYIVSASPEFARKIPRGAYDVQFTPSLYAAADFERHLQGMHAWPSDYRRSKKLVGIRVPSPTQLECYSPSPLGKTVLDACAPMFALFANQTLKPTDIIASDSRDPLLNMVATSLLKQDVTYFCFYTLPPSLHWSIVLLSLILLVSAALVIQDYNSGVHSYSLIHGLRSPIHWAVTFLSDFVLCLLWLGILVFIARFTHANTFNGRFFALAPLFFLVNLPFIYLISKRTTSPVLGATRTIFLLLIAHVLYAFIILIELFRQYPVVLRIIHGLRWLLLLVFPNVNVFTLIVAVLRPYACPYDDSLLKANDEFAHERYPHKVLIHSLILVAQFVIYFVLLIVIDTCKLPYLGRSIKRVNNQPDEDSDVAEERHRISQMTAEDKQNQALVADNISKRYAGSATLAVNRLAFAVPKRECFGLLGFNGSGKTSTFRMLVGDLQPSGGKIFKNSNEPLGYCPQEDITFSALTVVQSINYICRLHGLSSQQLTDTILAQFQLEKYRNRLVSHLSGGTCRRLHLALCLVGSPTLLLLDEPTAKVDPLLRKHIRLILQHRSENTSIIFASHSMLECEQLCDRLTIMVRGKACCLGSARHLKERFGTDYRIRLTPLQPSLTIPLEESVDNANEYIYPKGSLSTLFQILEDLVAEKKIAANYTVQLTSLEHVFLAFQRPVGDVHV